MKLHFNDGTDSIALDARVCDRSGVLSAVAEAAAGEALLPDSVSMPQFKTWINTTIDDANSFEGMDVPTLCTLVKVGLSSYLC